MIERVLIPGGTFVMGSDDHDPEEAPAHSVSVDSFWIDRAPVTNAEFATFVDDTDYVTVAERPLDPAAFPGAPAENLVPGSMVFVPTPGPVDLRHLSQWWCWTPGASWRHPDGRGSVIDDLVDHPVVHVAHEDADAYAAWAGTRLPTEAEWERAARGGLDAAPFVWGVEPEPSGEPMANYWHGEFPWRAARGYGTTSAVGSFPANGYGLSDMAGNVWEWTADWYQASHGGRPAAPDADSVDGTASDKPCCVPDNPRGGTPEASIDASPTRFGVPRKVIKGGSFLCADSYCRRYRPAARRPQPIDTGMSHIGFRCVAGQPGWPAP